MTLTAVLGTNDADLASFCRRWHVAELSLFGSVLRGDGHDGSDVDLLVDFSPEARHSLFNLVQMQDELARMLGRDVDLVEKKGIERSDNYIRRRDILSAAKVVYAAR